MSATIKPTAAAIAAAIAAIAAAAAAATSNLTPEFVLGMLSNIQDNLSEYQAKVLEMETELRTLKIENNILRKHVRELTTTPLTPLTPTPAQEPLRRGFGGYGPTEF
jgi:hypothetical protein